MIITNLNSNELSLYAGLNPYFQKAFDVAKTVCANVPEDGRYDVDGDNCYYMIQSYETKSPFEARFESHRKYIDIQVVLDGEEIIRFETASKLVLAKPYTEDYELFVMNKDYDSVRLNKGEIAIIYPGEPHAPGISADGSSKSVRKLVVKIRVD